MWRQLLLLRQVRMWRQCLLLLLRLLLLGLWQLLLLLLQDHGSCCRLTLKLLLETVMRLLARPELGRL